MAGRRARVSVDARRTYCQRMELTASTTPDALARSRRSRGTPRPAGDRRVDAGVRARRLPRAEQRRLRHDRPQPGRHRGLVDRAARRARAASCRRGSARAGWAAIGLLAGFALWTGLAIGWSESAERIDDRARAGRGLPRRARAGARGPGPHRRTPHDQRAGVRDRARDAARRAVAAAPAVVSGERPLRVPRGGQPRASSATR